MTVSQNVNTRALLVGFASADILTSEHQI